MAARKSKAEVKKTPVESTLNPVWDQEEDGASEEHTTITVSTVDGRVIISMDRNQAFDLYNEMRGADKGYGSFVKITVEDLLREFFVKGHAVSSFDLDYSPIF
jgi:hypothetical protein